MFSPSKLFSVICLFGLSIADLFPVILWFTWGVPIEKPVFELGSVLALLHLHSRGWSRACSSSSPRFSFSFSFCFPAPVSLFIWFVCVDGGYPSDFDTHSICPFQDTSWSCDHASSSTTSSP